MQIHHSPSSTRRGHLDAAVIVTFVVAVALEVAVFRWQSRDPQPMGEGASHIAVGTQPPTAFALRVLGGREQVNLLDLREKVVWMVFWGPWNEPSRRQLPEMRRFYQQVKDDPRFVLLTVLCEVPMREIGYDPDMIPGAKAFFEEEQLELPVYLDESGDARRAFQIQQHQYPTNVVIDASGAIQGIWSTYGPGLIDEIVPVVRNCLDEVAVKHSAG